MFVFFLLVTKPIKEVEINVGNVAVSCFALLDELGKENPSLNQRWLCFFIQIKHPKKETTKLSVLVKIQLT